MDKENDRAFDTRSRVGARMLRVGLAVLGLAIAQAAMADPHLPFDDNGNRPGVTFEFSDSFPAGIERRHFGTSVRVTGWKVGERAYFGQTQIGRKSAVGFVIPHGRNVLGITHRGIRYTLFF